LPRSPFASRARAHLDALIALERAERRRPAARPRRRPTSVLRVVAAGTGAGQRSDSPRPFVDAAWRASGRLLDACLVEGVRAGALASRDSFRFALEIEIDGAAP